MGLKDPAEEITEPATSAAAPTPATVLGAERSAGAGSEVELWASAQDRADGEGVRLPSPPDKEQCPEA